MHSMESGVLFSVSVSSMHIAFSGMGTEAMDIRLE